MRNGFSRSILLNLAKSKVYTYSISELLLLVAKDFSNSNSKSSQPLDHRRKFFQGLYYLVNKHYVRLFQKNGQDLVTITNQGLIRTQSAVFDSVSIPRPASWDRVWRVIAFDIPLAQKNTADRFRKKLKNLDFQQLQRSLWIYPYPCDDEISDLSRHYGIDGCVTIMEVHKISNDRKLRKAFGLI